MAKQTSTNIVEVWNWLVNVIESGELSLTEQIVLVHVVAKFNRTMWTPTKLNKKLLAAAINKDVRTVNSALDKLVKLKFLTEAKGVYFIGQTENPALPADDSRTAGTADKRTSSGRGKFKFKNVDTGERTDGGLHSVADSADTSRKSTDGGNVPASAGTAGDGGKIFK